jgi:hypothetical protein
VRVLLLFMVTINLCFPCNTSLPDLILKKKSNSIAYHFIQEGCARDEWRSTYVNTHLNHGDFLTKAPSAGEKRVSCENGFISFVWWTGLACDG